MSAASRAALAATLIGAAIASCGPATVSRIGPAVEPRAADCDIQVLDEGDLPSRPYRDLGVVALENCQDYRALPCLRWLTEAACGLGGQVAYLPEPRPIHDTYSTVQFRVVVAAYVADIRPDANTDPVLRSLTCDPPCPEGQRCRNRHCEPAPGPHDGGCGDPPATEAAPPPDAPPRGDEPQRCKD